MLPDELGDEAVVAEQTLGREPRDHLLGEGPRIALALEALQQLVTTEIAAGE
jgi:hypothetical protein